MHVQLGLCQFANHIVRERGGIVVELGTPNKEVLDSITRGVTTLGP